MAHPTEAELLAYARDPYRGAESAEIADHLDRCEPCARRVAVLRADPEEADPPVAPDSEDRELPSPPPPEPSEPPAHLKDKVRLLRHPTRPVAEDRKPRIDGYEILGELGSGAMGVVYQAWSEKERGPVALKVLHGEALATPDELRQFLRESAEAKAAWERAVAIGDPRPPFVRVFEIGECRGIHFISMEQAVAGSLSDRIVDLVKHPVIAAEILRTVSRAVHLMHAHGVIHRDLKPENILLRLRPGRPVPADPKGAPLEDLEPMVSDYGLAKRIDDRSGRSQSGVPVGTPYYMAPELLRRGSTGATAGSDIFALGVILYQLLTGRRPFEMRSLVDVLAVIHKYPRWPRGHSRSVPRDLEAVCLRCLEKKPDNRYASADDLADDLGRFIDGKRVLARLPDPARRLVRWGQTNPAAVVGIVLLVLVGLNLWNGRAAARARADKLEAVAAADRMIAHEATVLAARTEARVGLWKDALGHFHSAIADRGGDATTLRVERLFGFFAVGDEATLKAELADLERRTDLGRLAAHVALVRGATLLCDSATQREGREAVARALEARYDLGLFSRADLPFAEALAEPGPKQVVERLREAVRLDPLHFPAHNSLIVALMATGDLDEARRQANQMQAFLPESTLPSFARAMTFVIEGDREAMRRHLDDLAGRLGPERASDMTGLRAYCEHLADLLNLFEGFQAIGGGLGPVDDVRLFFGFNRLRVETKAVIRPFKFPAPTIGLWFQTIETLVEVNRMSEDHSESAFRRLIAMLKVNREALVAAMAAANRLVVGTNLFRQGDFDASRASFAEVARLGNLAADSPTLVPRSPIRYQSRILGVIADLVLLKMGRDPDPQHRERVRDHLHRLVVDGRRWPGERQMGLDLLLKLLTAPLTRDQARDWGLDKPGGDGAFRERRRQLLRYGRSGGVLS